ncbi:MAG: hypothetical protein DMF70_04280 [Acidobacteria bacterium]|nr:MAG: hypothetical protein DMF70_04280 [Acidobacteriota bacterium]
MKTAKRAIFVLTVVLSLVCAVASSPPVAAQKNKKPVIPAGPLLTRTITRHESRRFFYAGTVTVTGAPNGSVTIEGWQRNEVEVSAEIELHAATEADLSRLATLNNFVIDEDSNHLRIITTGTHDRAFMKRAAKDFPKSLIGLPWKIDYHIKVPAVTDLEVNAGVGPTRLAGVEGAIRLNAVQTDATLSLTGGLVSVIVQSGTVDVIIPALSWHGLGADIKVASGNLSVGLMPGFSGEINAAVLRTGEVKNAYPNLEPRERTSITPQSLRARAGNGGGTLTLTVSEGTIQINQVSSKQ